MFALQKEFHLCQGKYRFRLEAQEEEAHFEAQFTKHVVKNMNAMNIIDSANEHGYLPDHYVSGEPIMLGDRVVVNQQRQAIVVGIIRKGCAETYNFDLGDGGFLVEYSNGELEAWPEADEDIELIARAVLGSCREER